MILKRLSVHEIYPNEFSANEEDDETFERLKSELKSHGIVEPPVVTKRKGKYVVLSGWHRIKAWAELGHDEIPVLLVDTSHLSDIDFFNLTNNLNAIKGRLSIAKLRQIVKRFEIDPDLVNIFKVHRRHIAPAFLENMKGAVELNRRKTRVNELALQIARIIAEQYYDHIEEMAFILVNDLKIVGVINLEGYKPTYLRHFMPVLKQRIKWLLEEEAEMKGDESDAGVQADEES